MDATTLRFEVEQAGCSACAEHIKGALASLATVDEITIDEESDTATVSLSTRLPIDQSAVDAVLADASTGSGHDYRIKAGSWPSSRA